MQEKLFEFHIHQPLTPARRKGFNQIIEENAHHSPWPLAYEWDSSKNRLHAKAGSVKIDILFHADRVEAYGSAPLLVRMMFTKKKRAEFQNGFKAILQKLGFMEPKRTAAAKAKAAKVVKASKVSGEATEA